MNSARLAVALPLLTVLSFPARSLAADDPAAAVKKAEETVALFKKTDPSIDKFFGKSAGWAVFPSVAKGAIGIGGAGGKGVLFENGKAVARSTPRSSSSRTTWR
jgi:hypothetical protein